MGWGRYYLVYGSLLLPAPIFLFLVGFCLPISYHGNPARAPFATRVRRYLVRGIGIVAAGYLLNLLLNPDRPVWYGGVLQTIGLAIIVLGPALPLLPHRASRWTLVAVAVLAYLAFAAAFPALARWTAHHPASRVLLNDFPPWPWLSAAILGLAVGWAWLDARAKGPRAERTFFTRVAAAGALCVVAYVVWEVAVPTTPRFGFPRDFSVNRHWTPRGTTTALIAGGVALLLSGTYWLMERRRVALPWLVAFGQTALMLYFTHQLIELTLVSRLLGLRFNSWPLYLAANVALLVLLVYLARTWIALQAWRARWSASRAPAR
jgi:uncharacterized membrane protein